MKALRGAFTAGAFAWAVMLPLATFAASHADVGIVLSAWALAVYAIGAVVCHQLPIRSFHLWGAQMPVCARCTGIYAGAAVGAFGAIVGGSGAVARSLGASPRAIAVIAAAPTAATLIFEWTTGVMPSNAIRFAAGLWLGGVLAALVVAATSAPDPEVN